MRKILFIASLTFLLLNTSCFFRFGTFNNDPDLNMGLTMNREKALEFSDKLVEDIIAERNEVIYSKMPELFRKTYAFEEIPKTFEKINAHFGKLLSAAYKTEEVGYWMFPDGSKKPMRKFFYSAKTEKEEMGKYFLQVSVISEGENLSCINFIMVEYPEGIPPQLR